MTSDARIRAVAALDDGLRSGMYTFIRAARRPITRDEAAAAVGISRKLAAFHLDKLVDAGVLQADYQPISGIRKAGRAPKMYRPVDADIHVSIPSRQHDLLADILLDAVLATSRHNAGDNDGDNTEDAAQAAVRAAGERGHQAGVAERERIRPGRLGAERALTLTETVLHRHGFEPNRASSTCLRLGACPFHPLAGRAPELVCGINHAFLAGLVDGLGAEPVTAILDPTAGECCVEMRIGR